MALNNILIRFYQIIHMLKLPKLKFKDLDNRYNIIYKEEFNVDENDVNKANFIIFIISFISFLLSSSLLTKINPLLIISISFLLALIISYSFNQVLKKEIIKKENQLNALLYIVKINFSLIQKSHGDNADHAINFIKLISESRLPISKEFKKLLNKILLG